MASSAVLGHCVGGKVSRFEFNSRRAPFEAAFPRVYSRLGHLPEQALAGDVNFRRRTRRMAVKPCCLRLAPSSRAGDDLKCLLSEVKPTNAVDARMAESDP